MCLVCIGMYILGKMICTYLGSILNSALHVASVLHAGKSVSTNQGGKGAAEVSAEGLCDCDRGGRLLWEAFHL